MLSRYGEDCASNCKKGKKDYFWCWTRWHVGEVSGYNKKNCAEFTFLILMSTQLFVFGNDYFHISISTILSKCFLYNTQHTPALGLLCAKGQNARRKTLHDCVLSKWKGLLVTSDYYKFDSIWRNTSQKAKSTVKISKSSPGGVTQMLAKVSGATAPRQARY